MSPVWPPKFDARVSPDTLSNWPSGTAVISGIKGQGQTHDVSRFLIAYRLRLLLPVSGAPDGMQMHCSWGGTLV